MKFHRCIYRGRTQFYKLWSRTDTLAVPVLELSSLDVSGMQTLVYSSFSMWSIWMKLNRFIENLGLPIVTKDCSFGYSSS